MASGTTRSDHMLLSLPIPEYPREIGKLFFNDYSNERGKAPNRAWADPVIIATSPAIIATAFPMGIPTAL